MNGYVTVTAPDTVRIERLLPGPIERLWSYITDGRKRGTWFCSGEMELEPGGRVELVFRHFELSEPDDEPPPKYAELTKEMRMEARVVACEPPRLLVMSWPGEAGEPSEVTFELAPRGKQVLLVITHRRLANRDAMLSVAGGWHAHLAILEARLEGRKPPSFWKTHTRLEAEYDARIPTAR